MLFPEIDGPDGGGIAPDCILVAKLMLHSESFIIWRKMLL